MRVLRFILCALAPFKKYFIGMLLTICGVAAYTNFQGYFIKLMIDSVAENKFNSLVETAFWYGILQFAIVLIWTIYDYLVLKTNSMRCEVANKMVEMIKHYDVSFFQNNFAGSISSKIKDVSTLIPTIVYLMVENYFQLLLVILISVVLLSTIHFGFALALIVWVSLFLYMFFRQMKAVKGMSLDAAESDARIWGRIVDYIANIMAVKYHATNNYEQSILRNSQEEYVVSANRRAYYLLKCYFGMGMAFWFYIIGCLIFLIHLHKENAITPGDFAFVFSINYNIIDQLFYSTHTLRDFITNWGSVDNALVTLEEIIPNVRDKKNASVLKVVEGGIEFSNVNFSYNDSDSIFKNKTLKIVPKQRVGLVGYSGSGKSTFINLIVRLYDVQSGSIRIDGHDIRDVTQDSLRSSIAIIPQNPSMFNRSIIDNIRYSSINRTDREVIEAAKKAHAHEFIMKLPGGYNSIVGEGGLKLSGGQRQRLAIAGAILKNASILILDEATSQLDSVTESEIQEALSIVMKDKTTIVVAHRLSTILCMDRILVFDKGIIVEDGTHNELLIKNGLYKSLWDSQVGGLLPEYKL